MDSNVNKILQNIVNTATLAADEAKAAVHSAGKAVAGKYDEVKMNIELARLSDEQEDVFSDIGRMLFLMHTGAVKDTVMSDEGEKSPQQVIDALLVSAEQVQQEMDVITDKLTVCRNEKVCPCCGRICGQGRKRHEEGGEVPERGHLPGLPRHAPVRGRAGGGESARGRAGNTARSRRRPRGGAGSRSGAARGISAAEKTNDVYDLRIAVLFCHLLGAGLVP